MLTLDLPEKHKQILLDIIKDIIPDSEVWAYGSRLTDQHHDTSDLDLVIKQQKASTINWVNFKDAIAESNIPILVDVMDWDSIPEHFKHEIQKRHVILYPSRK